jgi:hypothetical protein
MYAPFRGKEEITFGRILFRQRRYEVAAARFHEWIRRGIDATPLAALLADSNDISCGSIACERLLDHNVKRRDGRAYRTRLAIQQQRA